MGIFPGGPRHFRPARTHLLVDVPNPDLLSENHHLSQGEPGVAGEINEEVDELIL